MKKEEKIQPSARHQHISNDSQAEEICGRWSKVANLWKAPFSGITKDKKIDKGIKNKDDSNGSPDLLLSTLLTMWKEEGIRRRLWENVCRKANWQ